MSLRCTLLLTVLTVAAASSAGESFAQDGLFARLNKSLVPTAPGLPTASPLGLIAPRLSNAVSIFQLGGMRTPAGRLSAIGVLSPRLSPGAPMASRSSRRGWRRSPACCGASVAWPPACGNRSGSSSTAPAGR